MCALFFLLQLDGKFEFYFALYHEKAHRFISENFLIRSPLDEGVKPPFITYFKDLSNDDFNTENTWIVCRLYRRGSLIDTSRLKKKKRPTQEPQLPMFEFKRPVGVGVFQIPSAKVEQMLNGTIIDAEIHMKTTENPEHDFPKLHKGKTK